MKKLNLSGWSARGLAALGALALAACSNDDDFTVKDTSVTRGFFISASVDGTEYTINVPDIESGSATIRDHLIAQMEASSNYTWIFSQRPPAAVGLIYVQGDPAPCYGFGITADSTVTRLGEVQIEGGYGTYGFCGDYVITIRSGTTPVDANGNTLYKTDKNGDYLLDEDGERIARADGATYNRLDLTRGLARTSNTILTDNIAGNGEQATLCGVVDLGDGTFLTSLVLSEAVVNPTGGNTTGKINYPDSVWVARFDTDFNLKHIYRDGRLGYSAGRMRSQYYSQIGIADDNYIYVFSGAYNYDENPHKPGALRIKNGADEFDQTYHYEIDRYFRKVWHITGTYFLLEIYNDEFPASQGAATQYAVVDMEVENSLTFLKNFPSKDEITATGLPMAYQGKMYFPVTVSGSDAAIYIIDPETATATKGLTVTGASSINAVGRLTDGQQ